MSYSIEEVVFLPPIVFATVFASSECVPEESAEDCGLHGENGVGKPIKKVAVGELIRVVEHVSADQDAENPLTQC